MNEPSYRVIEAVREGLPAIAVIDSTLDLREAHKYPSFLTVGIRMRSPNRFGSVDDAEVLRLNEMERSLLRALPADEFRFVGRITWKDRREILMYVRDADDAAGRLERVASTIPGEEISATAMRDPEWSQYRNFLDATPVSLQ